MSTLFPKTIVFKRVAGTLDPNTGLWSFTPGTYTFQGSVQPLSAQEIEALPIGRRDLGMMKVYSSDRLLVSKEGTQTPGDIVVWDNKEWEIVGEEANLNDIISHFKYYAQYKDPT